MTSEQEPEAGEVGLVFYASPQKEGHHLVRFSSWHRTV